MGRLGKVEEEREEGALIRDFNRVQSMMDHVWVIWAKRRQGLLRQEGGERVLCYAWRYFTT